MTPLRAGNLLLAAQRQRVADAGARHRSHMTVSELRADDQDAWRAIVDDV